MPRSGDPSSPRTPAPSTPGRWLVHVGHRVANAVKTRGRAEARLEYRRMSTIELSMLTEARKEAAPAAALVFLTFSGLALVSWIQGWELLGFPPWIWILLGLPALLLTIDLVFASRGAGLVRSRRAALLLLSLLVAGNLLALAFLVAGLVTSSTSSLSGGELLLTGFAIYATDVIVFGLWYWELDGGGPVARRRASGRAPRDFLFPQDDRSQQWRPVAWDYLYVSLTNSIAFSPTDTMPLSLRAKASMGLESAISAVTVLLVAARAVNVLGS